MNFKTSFVVIVLMIIFFQLKAQQVNTLYFMENLPVRHKLNPAFQPLSRFYVSLPVIGFTQLSVGNNSIALNDVIYNKNGQTITFLNENGSIDNFISKLKRNTVLNVDLETNILSLGYKINKVFWSFSVSEKLNSKASIPKDFFRISFYGTPDVISNSFDFTKMQSDVSLYTETAFGYSAPLTSKLNGGIKLKFLRGTANFSNINNNLTLNAGVNQWQVTGTGSINMAAPIQFDLSRSTEVTTVNDSKTSDWFKSSGIGAGVDIGVEYKLNEKISLTAALLDLGFINWSKNTHSYNYSTDYVFNGVGQYSSATDKNTLRDIYNTLTTGNNLVDSLTNSLDESFHVNETKNRYTTATIVKLNLGLEYKMLNGKLGFGLLSYSQFFNSVVLEEITTSVNARPYSWLNTSLSYSIFNGNFSNIGAGIGLKTGLVHWFAGLDYFPLSKSTLSLSEISAENPDINIPVPYKSKMLNFSVGINLEFDDAYFNNKRFKKPSKLRGLLRGSRALAEKQKMDNYKSVKISNKRKTNLLSGLLRLMSTDACKCK